MLSLQAHSDPTFLPPSCLTFLPWLSYQKAHPAFHLKILLFFSFYAVCFYASPRGCVLSLSHLIFSCITPHALNLLLLISCLFAFVCMYLMCVGEGHTFIEVSSSLLVTWLYLHNLDWKQLKEGLDHSFAFGATCYFRVWCWCSWLSWLLLFT